MKIIDTFTADIFQLINQKPSAVGSQLDFQAVNSELATVQLSHFSAPFKVISTVPSLDTEVCQKQTQKLNKFIADRQGILITISMDLPFAQKRSCIFSCVTHHKIWSDYLYHDFANRSGLFISECGLLCRAVLVLDDNNQVIYRQIANPVKSAINFKRLFTFIQNRFPA